MSHPTPPDAGEPPDAQEPAQRRRRKQARPQELLDAALSLFVEKGFASARAEEVALRAGVSKGTLYLYFPSKEELLKAVIAHNLGTRISAGAELAAAHDGSASALLNVILVDWWTQLYESPSAGVFKLIITEVRNFPEIANFYLQEVVEPAHQLLGTVLQRGIAAGEFRDVPVEHAVHSLVLPLIMICLHRHSLGACQLNWQLEGREFISRHIQLVLAGLQHGAPHPVSPPPPPSPPQA
ncbi:TetR/AcrR family transcriptional regulator [Aquabacterium sp. OR-4]|uniref:TetR/AcrR family transcriptional regulator n=1 Tax=Aquabacterium sp. OR-4 TaxID=2978127 RepID=UPI0021B1B0AA|nr:TetR/AcrR family transcriptional regulator [Aquabacterium sp. OR-4]MDT7834806.1 TetR/AcrR family transcriptional regulator [Aquabacterium sp. OR-4]